MLHPFLALQEMVLPAVERGGYNIVSGFSQDSTTNSETFIEAYSHDKETHTHYEWMWLLTGEGHMKINGRIYRLHPGDFCFLSPLVPHADVYDRDTPAYTSLWFSHFGSMLTFLTFSYQPLGQQNVGHLYSVHAPDEIGRVLVDLQRELTKPDAHSHTVKQGLLIQLTGHLLRIVESAQRRSNKAYGPVSSRVIAFLHQNYSRDLTLAEIARCTFLTPNYLSTVFKQETGQTIFESLAEIRIEEASRLLIENKIPLADIAQAVGYNSLDRFSRVFRRIKGVAPLYYGK